MALWELTFTDHHQSNQLTPGFLSTDTCWCSDENSPGRAEWKLFLFESGKLVPRRSRQDWHNQISLRSPTPDYPNISQHTLTTPTTHLLNRRINPIYQPDPWLPQYPSTYTHNPMTLIKIMVMLLVVMMVIPMLITPISLNIHLQPQLWDHFCNVCSL